jgi:hypothetical protein
MLLQQGGVTNYDVIINQLLLQDFTVLKIMMSAAITGMIGVYFVKQIGRAELHPKPGSIGTSVIGGLIFGVGFGILGYCPGTIAGAVGNGYLDALFGGLAGIIIGSGLFANLYPKLQGILKKGSFGTLTLPDLFKKVNPWIIVISSATILTIFLIWIESIGL